jgi:hypothetical protein
LVNSQKWLLHGREVRMKDVTKVLLSIVAAVTTLLQVPAIHDLVIGAIAAHPDAAALAGGVAAALALLYQPSAQMAQTTQVQQPRKSAQGADVAPSLD